MAAKPPDRATDARNRRLPRNRRTRSGERWLLAFALALAGHLAFVLLMFVASALQPDAPPRSPAAPPTSVNMRPISAQEWAQNRGEQEPTDEASPTTPQRPTRTAEAEKPKPKREEKPEGQIVDTAPGNDEVDPEAKYLAESNNKVKQETRSRDQSRHYKNAQPRTTSPQASNEARAGHGNAESPQTPGNEGTGNDDRPKAEAKQQRAVEIPDANKRDQIALRPLDMPTGVGPEVSNQEESDEVKGNSDRLRLNPGEEGGEEGASAGRVGGRVNLIPNGAMLDKIAGAAPNDHLQDVAEGDGTFLNTREWKYASFFNRVKQGVSRTWNPDSKLHQRDPTGQVYGAKDRHTILNVTLNQNGFVKEIWVEKSCGLDFLDLEAMASFERAQPFPNPPPGILKDDGSVQFQFGFFVEMGNPRLRLFRRAN